MIALTLRLGGVLTSLISVAPILVILPPRILPLFKSHPPLQYLLISHGEQRVEIS